MKRRDRPGRFRRLVRALMLSVLLVAGLGFAVTIGLVVLVERGAMDSVDIAVAVAATGGSVTFATTTAFALQLRLARTTHGHLREMEHRASHDELTGLLSRDELRGRLDTALRSAFRHDRVVGVLFLDLDGFKAINDSLGHEAGDALLCEFASRLRASVRAEDLVARFGGDEFVVVTLGLERESAVQEVAANIRKAFDRPVEIADGTILMTPSVGISIGSRANPCAPDELIAHADQAMYRAKRLRLGVQVFDDQQRREVLDRQEVEQALVPALADGQFQVYYQPIVSDVGARTVALEGLIRWNHPVHGVLGPDRFLPVAEEAGLVARLGEVVLREVVAQISVWNHLYPDSERVNVGINLAERQLVDPAFPDRIAEVLEWAGVDPRQLDLEVGEELLLRRVDDSSRVVHRLVELGCRLVIDDFGTSHGALSRVRDLGVVDVVKVDRTIIDGVERDPVSQAVIEATVSMAAALDIGVVAEGVETDRQRAAVVDHGIDLMQGFLFRRPVPAEHFERDGPMLTQTVTTG